MKEIIQFGNLLDESAQQWLRVYDIGQSKTSSSDACFQVKRKISWLYTIAPWLHKLFNS